MKVQTRLSFFSSIVFGFVFAVISVLIYVLYYQSGEKSIYDNLKKTSHITALFYLEEDELNKSDFAQVKAQFDEFVTNSFYQIYNENNTVSYGTNGFHIDPEILDIVRTKRSLQFAEPNFYCYGIFYEDNQGDFVVIAREKKDYLSQQLNALLWILIPAFFIGIIATIFLSRWLANVAYRPFREAIDQVNNISINDLDVCIKSPMTEDELQDLIETFNNLLSKISDSFIIQRNFVNYVSHEFKTPLASMLGNLEVFSIKERSPEEYNEVSQKLIKQITQLEDILNTLIIISDLGKMGDAMSTTRIDELIWEIIDKVSEQYANAKVLVNMNVHPDDESILDIMVDRTQLLMALFNLIENAVKYSQGNPVEIDLYKNEAGNLQISIKDTGIGIPTENLENITKPFFRANNVNQLQGSGIGLSIALKILEKNKIKFDIESEMGKGTIIRLTV